MSDKPPTAHRLLRFASLQWHGAQTALLDVFALRPPDPNDPRLPGFEMVLDLLHHRAPCGNGPLDRAIAAELGERSPFWYAHGATEPPKPDETAVLVAALRERIEALTTAATEAHRLALDPPPGRPPAVTFGAIVDVLEPLLGPLESR